MNDYSQFGEQATILELFKDYNPETSRFLDIGAYDGRTFSNTRALLELGWGGVYVEPAAYGFDALMDNIRSLPEEQRQRITPINAGINIHPGLKEFWYSKDQMATIVKEQHDKWVNQIDFHPLPCFVYMLTLADLFSQFPGPYHFVNIDAEGLSPHIFLNFPLSELQPHAFCVEYDKRLVNMWEWANRFAYTQTLLNGVNVIYAK